ncbi:hypothetical protein FDECE_17642 [Fusarium decemcellulare]|nr:hypothetical protein FDECE_17642 [Fusarium decemcellulare]
MHLFTNFLGQKSCVSFYAIVDSTIASFSISDVGYLVTGGSQSVCVDYNADVLAGPIVCPDGSELAAPITCEVSATGKLLCSVAAKTCTAENNDGTIHYLSLPGTFNTLYTRTSDSQTWYLALGSENVNGNGLEAVTVSVKALAADP